MDTSPARVLIAEDFKSLREFVASTLKRLGLRVVCAVSDGAEAVRKTEEFQPDLVVLDIGLPELNGIEVARRIRKLPHSPKILFVSQERSPVVVQESLAAGGSGYVLKTDLAADLARAVKSVLAGHIFLSRRLADSDLFHVSDVRARGGLQDSKNFGFLQPTGLQIGFRHEAHFYSDDEHFLGLLAEYVSSTLNRGNAVIVVLTPAHREGLLSKLKANSSGFESAMEQGRYFALDARETLSSFMCDGVPDPAKFLKIAGDLITTAAKSVKSDDARVSALGECAPLLWMQGKAEGAIRLEQLWNEIGKKHNLDLLCGYPLSSFHDAVGARIFEKICAEHSTNHTHQKPQSL